MKKQRIVAGLGMTVLIMVTVLAFAGCTNLVSSKQETTIINDNSRYINVQVNNTDLDKNMETKEDKQLPYKLVSSGHNAGRTTNYYLYYLGYTKNVPVSFKSSYSYDGQTPISIKWEKSTVEADSVSNSLTTAYTHTVTDKFGTSVDIGVSTQAGAIFATVAASIKASFTYGHETADGVSTSNTYTTVHNSSKSESESITVTIGEHGEAAGIYRYALFGITDVYCLFEVDATTNKADPAKTKLSYCARENTLAWGLDFTSFSGDFGGTGANKLTIPDDIDFSQIPADDTLVEGLEPPQPSVPDTKITVIRGETGQQKGGASRIGGSGGDIDSKSGGTTNWVFEITGVQLINERGDGTFTHLGVGRCSLTVEEGQSDRTKLQLTKNDILVNLTNYKAKNLLSPTSHKLTGSVVGKNHDWVNVYTGGDYGLIRNLKIIIDGSGDDEDHIAFEATLNIKFEEPNQ